MEDHTQGRVLTSLYRLLPVMREGEVIDGC